MHNELKKSNFAIKNIVDCQNKQNKATKSNTILLSETRHCDKLGFYPHQLGVQHKQYTCSWLSCEVTPLRSSLLNQQYAHVFSTVNKISLKMGAGWPM